MSVHEDIIDTYKRMTNVQALAAGAPEPFPETKVHAHSEGVDGKLSIVPGRVYILRLNDTILGVLATEQRALDEAHAFMWTDWWETVNPNRHWLSHGDMPSHHLRIDVHDVR